MKVYMLWHGGSSYAVGDRNDVEEFETLGAAIRAFEFRHAGRDSYYPCVNDETSAWVFKADPNADGAGSDLYPDIVLTIGPRGGVNRSNA